MEAKTTTTPKKKPEKKCVVELGSFAHRLKANEAIKKAAGIVPAQIAVKEAGFYKVRTDAMQKTEAQKVVDALAEAGLEAHII